MESILYFVGIIGGLYFLSYVLNNLCPHVVWKGKTENLCNECVKNDKYKTRMYFIEKVLAGKLPEFLLVPGDEILIEERKIFKKRYIKLSEWISFFGCYFMFTFLTGFAFLIYPGGAFIVLTLLGFRLTEAWDSFLVIYAIGYSIWCLYKFSKNTICKHGVFGGSSYNQCKTCFDENIANQEKLIRERKEKEQIEHEKKKHEYEQLKIEREKAEQLEQIKLKNLNYLLSLSPEEFENAVAKLFVSLGYSVKQTPFTGDGGLDAIATKDGTKHLIECKRYAIDNLVGRPELQKFFAAIIQENASGGFFVTTSNFSDKAKKFIQNDHIKQRKIELIDGNKLIEIIQKAYPEENNINKESTSDIKSN